jgi:osmoprotectant transport system permease protein
VDPAGGGGMNYVHLAYVWLNDPLNWTNPGGILDRLWEHLYLSLLSLIVATVVALPIGLWSGHTGRGGYIITVSNLTRAIPTFGLLTLLVVTTGGFGAASVVPAMALFGIPPILANTYTGMREVDRATLDAAKGMGMSGGQLLRRVEFPMAMPYIASGLRTAAVQIVATVTLASLVAGGGLGTIISAGLGLGIAAGGGQILAGGFLVVVLALAVNALTGVIAHYATPVPLRKRRRGRA